MIRTSPQQEQHSSHHMLLLNNVYVAVLVRVRFAVGGSLFFDSSYWIAHHAEKCPEILRNGICHYNCCTWSNWCLKLKTFAVTECTLHLIISCFSHCCLFFLRRVSSSKSTFGLLPKCTESDIAPCYARVGSYLCNIFNLQITSLGRLSGINYSLFFLTWCMWNHAMVQSLRGFLAKRVWLVELVF